MFDKFWILLFIGKMALFFVLFMFLMELTNILSFLSENVSLDWILLKIPYFLIALPLISIFYHISQIDDLSDLSLSSYFFNEFIVNWMVDISGYILIWAIIFIVYAYTEAKK